MRRARLLLCLALLLQTAGLRAETAQSIVPMTLTPGAYGGGRIYVPVRIGDVMGPMRLDTGASTTRVKLAPWNKDFPVIAQSLSTGASGALTHCDDVAAANVALKASQGNDIARGKYELSRCATNDGDDLLGLDFFKGARFTLAFANREMTFFPPPGAAALTPLRLLGAQKKLMGVATKIGDAAPLALIDTGAEISAVDLSFMLKHRRLFTLVSKKAKAGEAGGKSFVSRLIKIKEIDLGAGRVLHDVYALAYDFGPLRDALGPQTPIILGYNVISRFTWDFDFTKPEQPSWSARATEGH